MIPEAFEYERVDELDVLLEKLSRADEVGTRILAGGHWLLPKMKIRSLRPPRIFDIGGIKQLRFIDIADGRVRIGALSRHADVLASRTIGRHFPLLAEVARGIGDVQVRNRGTMGGAIASGEPHDDWSGVLYALDAEVVIQNRERTRHASAGEFFSRPPGETLGSGDLIVRVELPISGYANARHAIKHHASGATIAGVTVVADIGGSTLQDVRVATTGVSGSSYRAEATENALSRGSFDELKIAEAAALVTHGQQVLSNQFGSREYRADLAEVAAWRAMTCLLR